MHQMFVGLAFVCCCCCCFYFSFDVHFFYPWSSHLAVQSLFLSLSVTHSVLLHKNIIIFPDMLIIIPSHNNPSLSLATLRVFATTCYSFMFIFQLTAVNIIIIILPYLTFIHFTYSQFYFISSFDPFLLNLRPISTWVNPALFAAS